ncbi:MAG: AAA family ATPase [Candidatus Zixiibacteriota bacterium]|jgi:predicted ATPase
MRVTEFRIKNYKSIIDTGWCELAKDITVLAGKNEAGKTAVLEALRDFDPRIEEISAEAYPKHRQGVPEIGIKLETGREEIDRILNGADLNVDYKAAKEIAAKGIVICRDPDGYYLTNDTIIGGLSFKEEHENSAYRDSILSLTNLINSIYSKYGRHFEIELGETKEEARNAVTQTVFPLKSQLTIIPDIGERNRANILFEKLEGFLDTKESENEDAHGKFATAVAENIPKVVFFSTFDDILPDEISLEKASNTEIVLDFAKIAGLDFDSVRRTDDAQDKRNLFSKASAKLSGYFGGFYTQSNVEITAELEVDTIRFWVVEEGGPTHYKTTQRSKGFQWFLSFFLRLRARGGEDNMILIDEPGLYLHAKAQQDVLKVLTKTATNGQLIYSTHSPYLIDAGRLDRVRLLVNKKDIGSEIINEIHKEADQETLTPILTAIGLDLTFGLNLFGDFNVVTEGPSDYYYLLSFKNILKERGDFSIIPCMGGTKTPHLVSLLIGWGFNYCVVLDNDPTGKRVSNQMQKRLPVEGERFVFAGPIVGDSIEDLFAIEDFKKYVLEDDTVKIAKGKISGFLKASNIKKVLIAKRFFEKTLKNGRKIKLTQETKANFAGLLGQVLAVKKKYKR